ncbi:unnamed protein product [Arctia plantaginis]|uniref:Uncharacterized protein n=1 Tax=Arctia plantaginis TaxID=874455 RepID=A0A8S1AMH2_ARCPL|nr:unnamed protein product [Arctia plantaginis]
MGLIWKSAMPLLTTLAALVIIVHCVEEDLETEYRHDLRPRILDKGTSDYEQSWRVNEEGPVVQKSRLQDDWESGSPDASPKRRRPGRKRKRRPQTEPNEEIIAQERFPYPDIPPRPYYDVDYENSRQTTEMPKRRRKKPAARPIRWTDDDVMVVERPMRKNAGRRKKIPSLETWPELSEFRDTANLAQEKVETEPEENPHEIIAEKVFGYNREITKHRTSGIEDHYESMAAENVQDTEETSKIPIPVDKSLSEFSMELVSKPKEDIDHESRIHIPQNAEQEVLEVTKSMYHGLENRELDEHKSVHNNRLRMPKRKKKNRGEDIEKDKAIEKTDINLLKFLILKRESSLGEETTSENNKHVNISTTYIPKFKTMEQLKSGLNARFTGIDDITYIKLLDSKHDSKLVEETTTKNYRHNSINTTYIPYLRTTEQLKSGFKARLNKIDDTRKLRRCRKNKKNLVKSKSKTKISNTKLKKKHVLNEPALEVWMDEIFTDIYPTDQLSLKDILKRSNGTSLSEILQQHNLSLADLLRGKEHAVSILKPNNVLSSKSSEKNITKVDINENSGEPTSLNGSKILESLYVTEPTPEHFTTTEAVQTDVEPETVPTTTAKPLQDKIPKMSTSRRYPITIRKKLRIRPVNNTTNIVKGQLSRDLITLNSRKYSNFRRNATKSRQWKDIISTMIRNNTNKENNNTLLEKTTTESVSEETTISSEISSLNSSYEDMRSQSNADIKLDDISMDVTEPITTETTTEMTTNYTEKTLGIVSMPRPTAISSGLRRQALDNRLKRKRLKNKTSTTEQPQDDIIKHLFGMGTLVSSSEFIARTQGTKITEATDSTELFTLEDFITTERASRIDGNIKLTSIKTTTPQSLIETTTPEAAKVEIEEIFSDTETRAKLSRILKERNMTLSELVELRERGSSHIHLADIFHNASREPNPAEPFLSKSLLEPISKETYPLRAILEANLHDANGRATTVDPNINIPVVMDFRNNVNENAENMGIMSLFNNFSNNITQRNTPTHPENRNLTVKNASSVSNTSENVRESRVLDEVQDDVVSWNEIFSIMGRNHNDEIEEMSTGEPFKKITIEDVDGDGLIVLEDLEHLTDFDNNIASAFKDKLDAQTNSDEKASGVLDKIPSHTKSVTVATASIAGLAMVLFLLTYAAYKWKHQKPMIRKRSFCDDRIPTPVFEHRKGHKNNSSTRSISPMIQTSNIYTLNTLDSQNGKESPDYMWDSLRKPFQ